MNSREVDAETEKLSAERGWGSWAKGDQRSVMLLHLVNDREEARKSLLRHIEALRHDLDHLEHSLHAPDPLLNTLGELQQRPAAVEAAVGEFAAANRALQRYLVTYPAEVA
jgi:hypothetical protein